MYKFTIHKLTSWIICLSITQMYSLSMFGQERFGLIFSEQPYLINPSLTGISNENRYSLGFTNHGYFDFTSLHASFNYYSSAKRSSFEGLVISNKDGAIRHNILTIQFSHFLPIFNEWWISLGVAPEFHNYSVDNEKLIFESQLVDKKFIKTIYPSIWGGSISIGASLFSKSHTFGFTAQNLIENTNYNKKDYGAIKGQTTSYIISFGSNIDLDKHSIPTEKRFLRPHIITILHNKKTSFFYGSFFGTSKNQIGIFFVSTSKTPFLGISPAFITQIRDLRVALSIKIFPTLPSLYMFGNELHIRGKW